MNKFRSDLKQTEPYFTTDFIAGDNYSFLCMLTCTTPPTFQKLSSNETIIRSCSQMLCRLRQTAFWQPLAWLSTADTEQSLCRLPSEVNLTSEWQAAISSVLQSLSSQLATWLWATCCSLALSEIPNCKLIRNVSVLHVLERISLPCVMFGWLNLNNWVFMCCSELIT